MLAISFKDHFVRRLPPVLKPLWVRLEASPLGYRIARGAFWSLAGGIVSRALTLIGSVLIARMLGKAGFGRFGVIQSTVMMFTVFANFGMGLTASKHVAELRTVAPTRAGRIIALSSLMAWGSGALMALFLAVFAPWLAIRTLASPELTQALRISALLLLLGSVNGAQNGVLTGFEAFKRIAVINLYVGIVSFPVTVLGALWWGLDGAVWGLVTSQAFSCFLCFLGIKAEAALAAVSIGYAHCKEEWKVLWEFSLPAVFSSAMGAPVNWFCVALIVNHPDGYNEMGVFNAANQWRNAILFLPTLLAGVTLPLLANLDRSSDRQKYLKVLNTNLLLCAVTALAIALPVALLGQYIMAAYGATFSGGGSFVLPVLCAAAVITATLNVIGQAMASQGKMWAGLALNFIWAAAMILSCLALRRFGALGLALASLVAYSVHLCTVSFYVYRRLDAFLWKR